MTTTIAKRQNGNVPATFGNVVDNIFQNSLHRFFDDHFFTVGKPLHNEVVPVNVRENNQGYDIEVIAPGCRKDAFKVNVNGNLLTIGYEQQEERTEQQEKNEWRRTEYQRHSFTRTFTLDDSVDVNGIQAGYKDGILHIHLPKNEKAKEVSKTIEIQ
ncbi:HSP20 family protein [Filimonas lacunae]|uniref:HSP20 family protein n=1 Tax=Filimonas lacunae TaxID=477680 RepID=A0A173MFQ2_9BACT|nr:Hsp20/alpha crystallin family protein [Filimonas lacunae]BAV06307.1 small heat shock protein [Filimonas lacunae]SIT25738.1 HSP20 family protein [Filimonas lacunae]